MIIIVAGPQLSVSALHCASVGHWAFADDARLNAEHWRAAAEGKPGYRLPGTQTKTIDPIELATAAGVIGKTAAAAALIATMPADLATPPFLKRVA